MAGCEVMQSTNVQLSPKPQISECRSSKTICVVVNRPDHHCGDDLVHVMGLPLPLPLGPGFEFRHGQMGHLVITMSKKFTHDCSRTTRPCHQSAGRQNEEQPSAVAKLTLPSDHYPRAMRLAA